LRALALGRTYALALTAVTFSALVAAAPAIAASGTGGADAPPEDAPPPPSSPLPTTPLPTAQLSADGRTAIPPAAAPDPVRNAIYAANRLTRKPYRYGGGHGSFDDSAYDCSGSVSYALHGAGVLDSPLDSSSFMRWGDAGRGQWITIYTNPRHAYTIIAGLRFDTSGPGARGPRWRLGARYSRGFRARHPDDL
jgi:cell wall-associated NlpC family hydrolase